MDSLLFSLNATIPIFAVIFISYFLRRRGILPEAFLAGADRFTFRVLLPVLLFRDIAGGRISEQFDARFLVYCVAVTTIMFAAVWLGAELFLKERDSIGAFTQGAFRSSLAIFGIAFAQNIYGDAGLVPLMIVAIVPLFNIFSVIVLTVRAPGRAYGAGAMRMCVHGILTNPLIIGIVLGIPFAIFGIDFPPIASKTLNYFASMATPLALVTIGGGFEGSKAIKKLRPTLVASALKLLILPAVFLTIGYALGFRDQALVALLVMLGTPSTVTCYLMCKNMGGDYVLSSSIIVITTAFSAVTLTAFLYILRAVGAI